MRRLVKALRRKLEGVEDLKTRALLAEAALLDDLDIGALVDEAVLAELPPDAAERAARGEDIEAEVQATTRRVRATALQLAVEPEQESE